MKSATLNILHFNDVYRCGPQKIVSGKPDTIDVTQFSALLDGLRSQWELRSDGKREGLVLFSGDVFSPSIESTVTRGSHMVPVMNELAPDVSLTGNHDFDFGYRQLVELMKATTFPWILSNIIDVDTSEVPPSLNAFQIFERSGLRIGVIGLVEEEWIGTVANWPANFVHKDMQQVGMELSKTLRGEHQCDIIVALTHCRLPNDIVLAKGLLALSPSAQQTNPVHNTHGVDLILGGHDHMYYASRGMDDWENYDRTQTPLGAEQDHGDILVCKSGTDFRELSELKIELEDTPAESVRRKVIKYIQGIRHVTQPGSASSPKMAQVVKTALSSVSSTFKAPVCTTVTALDVRSQALRTEESGAGNWIADVIRHAYDDTLSMQGQGAADLVLVCAGTFRGDSVYGPGVITLGDIMEILPFEDPVIVIELDGAAIWDALESAFVTWPAQEGRFPVVSGCRVSWDSRKRPGERVLGVWLTNEIDDTDEHSRGDSRIVDGASIERSSDRKYKVVTRQYMAEGHDGFTAMTRGKHLIDDESGQIMSAIVRQYLMGSHYVNTMARLKDNALEHLHPTTKSAIRHEQQHQNTTASKWKHAAHLALQWSRSRRHYQNHIGVCMREEMDAVDPIDGKKIRAGQTQEGHVDTGKDQDLLTINPSIDGRLKDVGR